MTTEPRRRTRALLASSAVVVLLAGGALAGTAARAATQLGVDGDMLGDGGGAGEGVDEGRLRIDGRPEGVVVGPVAERLDAAGGGARADRHEPPRAATSAR